MADVCSLRMASYSRGADMVECPLCEAEPPADHPNPEGWVIAHATSKTDEDHKGVGGQKMKEMLSAQETVNGPTEEPEGESEPTETDTEPDTPEASKAEGEDPTAQTPPHEARETGSDGDSDTPSECPRCGSELVDVRDTDHLRHESGRDVPIPDRWDYVCSDWCEGGASGFEVND